ncbi:D-erythronate dehydrogenase [Ruegeria marina]|uniref:Nucleoside-diphosphate-sugar epimerase n=1 Tax=Ruegeria marina TaxID=639004 RepID=A0A1G6X9W0_9RHOB|nr:D-erythronate dehydrogenase [Ruegeria marina]SDD74822.1 Nucleoside-diphosphate-sugar epimerase [Ruegeria marina]
MSILILGGGGMVGQKLARSLADHGLTGHEKSPVTLFDISFPETGAPGKQIRGSVTDPLALRRLAAARPEVIFHLASIVSGEAESDFELGWLTNMHSFWTLLEALRTEHLASGGRYRPRFVFTSSIAVFGGPYPDRIGDEFLSAPLTSYGAQKACNELMLTDFSRKGFVDGISIRLPTICVRPGKANKAASSFFSGIIREPLNGVEAILPVPDTVRHWHASPRAAVGFLRHAATMDLGQLHDRRALSMPGVSCTVAEQIEALRAIAGNNVVALIRSEPDETVQRIIEGWPRDFDTVRARKLGFAAESDFAEIIRIYLDDDLHRR